MITINYLEKNFMINRLNAYFKARAEDKFWRAFCIILLISIFNAATTYINLTRSTITATNLAPGGLLYGLLIAIVIISTFFGWFLSNLVYQGVCLIFGAHGSLKRILTLSGYASLPMLFQAASRFLYFLISGEKSSLITNNGIIAILIEHFTIFSILTLILTIYAISENYNISLKKSVLVAFSPILIVILSRLVFSSYFGTRLDRTGILFN